MKIGIIGGGAAGLAAAYEFCIAGHQPEVFEGAPFLGGQASTFDVNGVPLEKGYHHLFKSDTAMSELVDELGLGNRMRWIDSNVGYFVNGKVWRFTSHHDLLKFSPLSLLDRIRLGILTLNLQRRKEWHSLENITASRWLALNSTDGIYKTIFEPMLRGKFGSHYDRISLAWLWNKSALRTTSRGGGIRGKLKEQLAYPVGSFGEIFDELEARINRDGGTVFTKSPVMEISVKRDVVEGLVVRPNGAEPENRSFDMVLSTTPSYVFPKLVQDLPGPYKSKLTDKTYLAAVLVVLIMDRPLSPHYWMYIGDRSIPFLGVIEHTNFIPPAHYNGAHIVYLTNYLEVSDPLYQMSPDELYQHYLPHLKKINPQFESSWVEEFHHHKVDAAQPIVTTGYAETIPDHRTPIEGLYLANTTQIYPEDRGTNYSVRMGRQVARLMIDDAQLRSGSATFV